LKGRNTVVLQQKKHLSSIVLVISWAASLTAFWTAAHLIQRGLGWFALSPILVGFYVNSQTRNVIKRLLVAVFGWSFILITQNILFIFLGFGSAFYVVHVLQSFPSITDLILILAGLALASNGMVRLLAHAGLITFVKPQNNRSCLCCHCRSTTS
jgi:hypothetical protein